MGIISNHSQELVENYTSVKIYCYESAHTVMSRLILKKNVKTEIKIVVRSTH